MEEPLQFGHELRKTGRGLDVEDRRDEAVLEHDLTIGAALNHMRHRDLRVGVSRLTSE